MDTTAEEEEQNEELELKYSWEEGVALGSLSSAAHPAAVLTAL